MESTRLRGIKDKSTTGYHPHQHESKLEREAPTYAMQHLAPVGKAEQPLHHLPL